MMFKIFIALSVVLLVACVDTAIRLDELAKKEGFSQMKVMGMDFQHHIYFRQNLLSKSLHVYLEGDGRPWRNKGEVAFDPSMDSLLSLELMKLDAASVLYVGRPCYHGDADIKPCHPWYWTNGRYSQDVVDSMSAVIKSYVIKNGVLDVVLIGQSGGGTLAMLLAEKLNNVSAVVTLAGNLDVRRWSQYHDYTELEGSLNPIERQPLIASIKQLHYAGDSDKNIPYHFIFDAIKKQKNAEFILLNNVDHDCCWEEYWPAILKRLDKLK